MPMRPSSPIFLTVSCGKRQSRSISAAIGRISLRANSRAVAWISSCSSVSLRCTIFLFGEGGCAPLATPPAFWRRGLTPPSRLPRLFLQEAFELLRQLRHHLEEVAHDAVVRDLEDRRLRVL